MLKALISFLPLAIDTLPDHSQQPGIHLFPYAAINDGSPTDPVIRIFSLIGGRRNTQEGKEG